MHVEVQDSAGNRSSAQVHGSIDEAIVSAVADLLGVGDEWGVSLSDTETDHGRVVVVTARNTEGERVAGAACIEFGRPWAVARALVEALGT